MANPAVKPAIKPQSRILLPILVLLLIGVGLILLDRQRILIVLRQADWSYLPGALAGVALSYSLVSISYAILAQQVGIPMRRGPLAAAYFVTAVMNRVVRSGGAAGYSVRYLLMKPYGVSLNAVLISSFVHFLLGSLVMQLMLPLGVLWLLWRIEFPPALARLLAALAALCLAFALGTAALLFSDWLRRRLVRSAIWLAKVIARRDIAPALETFNRQAGEALLLLGQAPRRSSIVLLLINAEWWANAAVLAICLSAFGAGLPLGAAAAMYVVAIMAGVLTALPGGIGAQEAAITSLAIAQGVSFEQAILAAMLFRIVHFFIPYLLSSIFYWRLLQLESSEVVL